MLVWVPGHVGFGGNKVADATARKAPIQGTLAPGVLSLDCKTASVSIS